MRTLIILLFLSFGINTYSQTIDGITSGEATYCSANDASGVICCTGNIGQIIGWELSTDWWATSLPIQHYQNCITYFSASNSICYRAITTIGYSTSTCITVLNTIPPEVTENGDTLTSSEAVSYQWFLNGDTLYNDTNRVLIVSQVGSYHVETVDSNGCASASINRLVGTKEIHSLVKIKYSPNPTEGLLQIKMELNSTLKYDLKITNILGEQLLSEKIDNTTMFSKQYDLSKESNGVYFLSIENSENSKSVHRIVLNK
ncbi:MAG: T9SS type A sorting domain-containing protein [Bacteroidetes bacterium]|nr:T9SS type A sorting domain-containing protein [Bacteroidota bacterium]